MKIGKIPENILKRTILNQIHHRRKEVLVGPKVGEDCAVLDIDKDYQIVLSTDPITGTVNDIGTLAVHITANDIASNGAEIIGILLTILLPDKTEEISLKKMIREMEDVCKELNIEILGGHTEVTAAVNQPIVTVTGVGVIPKEKTLIEPFCPSKEIVMTKWAGLEGTAIIAREKEMELGTKYPKSFIENAKSFIQYISVVPEAKIAKEVGFIYMHDITEGGIFGALWEIAAALKSGLEVDLKKISLKQETIEICEFYHINPYLLISSGSMLIITSHGNELVEILKRNNIMAAVIGKLIDGNDKIVRNEEEIRFLEPPKSDELYKVMK